MAKTRMVTQFGMGTSIRSQNYTEAAARGIRDALWHNSLNAADAFGFPKEAMLIEVEIGVQHPDKVDSDALLGIFPYGQPSVRVVKGGLDVAKPDGSGVSVIANVAIIVSFDMAAAGAASTSSTPGQSAGGQS
ncbi:Lin0512 family protein [Cobetia amphilecti]|uniref:Lin0512 family protein n=1 Tax=Cobetia amphilecti TaxID=1055104 RepID=UPI001CDB1447|nr:Lin0512 family protein [Cobetia amphilecti]UBU47647.1 Lin0512 family protein [Cobetia amphilecti]